MFDSVCPSLQVLFRAVIASICLASFLPSIALSATAKLSARFEIVQSLSVQHERAPSYSVLQAPESSISGAESACYLNPETSDLSGDACISESGERGVMLLTGSQHQVVDIRVKGSKNQLLRYEPEFFESGNATYDDFVVPSAHYPIQIGGTMTVQSANDNADKSDQSVFYAVEISYP